MEKYVPPISDHELAGSDLNEDVDDCHRGEEPPALKQNPSDSTQNCSSHSLTQSKKRKCQSNNDNISAVLKDISKVARTLIEKNKEDGVDACYKKLEKLEEDISKMTRMMMDKNNEDVVGFKKLGTLEEDISKMTKLMMEKSKEVDAGFKKLETLEEDVSKMTKLTMEKNKEDDVGSCFKKLETLGEDVSAMSRMMMKIYKEDDMGACIEKLEKIGWGAQDPMYNTALLLFGQSADYRKLWLHLKPESCGNWVKNAGSMFGLLD